MSATGNSNGNSNENSEEINKNYLYEITCIHNTKQFIKNEINNIKKAHNIKNPLNPNLFMKQLIRGLRRPGAPLGPPANLNY